MSSSQTWRVVRRNGRPVWRVCEDGRCVEADSGAAALAALAQENVQPQPEPSPSTIHRGLVFLNE
jgi:hypothetical protein